ncbi:hypothetical protein ACHHYP_10824 [Achlya hypogyna]|uniref:Uncharacterized protein n=1 Tax=Achlya hypogyna TaxID=1202772 RepID=A0A1V9YKN1_ACHHY|nr:hypothetical protein ACHHYP_10824 [Achlya hypogyna]
MSDNIEALVLKLCERAKDADADADRSYLILGEVEALNKPIQSLLSVDLLHVGILMEWNLRYAANPTDGQFEIANLIAFVRACADEEKAVQHPAPSYFKYTKEAHGVERILRWLMGVVRENATKRRELQVVDGLEYFHEKTLCLLVPLLEWQHVEWATAITDEANDRHLPCIEQHFPASVLEDFLRHFLLAWIDCLDRYGISSEMPH